MGTEGDIFHHFLLQIQQKPTTNKLCVFVFAKGKKLPSSYTIELEEPHVDGSIFTLCHQQDGKLDHSVAPGVFSEKVNK